jgi:effector-binding domain-containing protein
VIDAPDIAARNAIIVAHLRHMERQLEETQETVASLRSLLEPPPAPIAIEYRVVPRTRAAAIAARVTLATIATWWSDAFAELYGALRAAGQLPTGPGGGLYPTELFTDEVGDIVVFVPISVPIAPVGRVRTTEIPAAELAIATHHGPLRGADRTYGALGTYVAERALGVEGPIREHYLVSPADTADDTQLRTEIAWPVFRTRSAGETDD